MARVRHRIRTNDPAGTRRRVLDVAARSFQAVGYGGASVQDLVREAGVTGGALHHHFPTKKHLGLAVIAERVGPEVAATWAETVRAAPSGAEGILRVVRGVIDELDGKGAVSGCPLGNLALELSLADDDFRAAIAHEYAAWRDALAQRLREDAAQGQAAFAADDPDGFAEVVVSLVSGALSIAKAEQGTGALKSCLRHLERVMAP
jgi:TetR/AcrR family transcriptional repressor of nem operon